MAQSKRNQSSRPDLSMIWTDMRENVSREAMGIFAFLVGGYLLFSLLVTGADAYIAYLAGWTGWLAGLAFLVLGAVLMVGKRAGYWNPEALVGGELVLLSLQMGTFVQNHVTPNWTPPEGGTPAGLIGWGLGNLILSGLGRWPAALTILILLGLGGYLLLRHTPLLFLCKHVPILERLVLGRNRYGGTAIANQSTQSDSADTHTLRPIDPGMAANKARDDGNTAGDDPPEAVDAEQATPSRAEAQPVENKSKKRNPPKNRNTPAGELKTFRSSDKLPPIDLLEQDTGRYGSRDTERTRELIEKTLEDFNIPVRVVNVDSGPTVTQYGVEPLYVERAGRKRKVRVSRIVNLSDDLALALAAPSVRIEAPVPGQPFVGIEVPNNDKTLVGLRGLLESVEMEKNGGALPLALGRDTAGAPVVIDLTRAPHLLIAGATGSGKSVCINTIITSLLMHHGPESLRFVMVDPKMVELPGYNGVPHLIGKVLTEMDYVVGALTWLLLQMDDRYQKFRDARVRNITAYNEKARDDRELEQLPYIVMVVDELADLMMTAPEEVEKYLVRLAQMARATGIHMILATQRPSTDVVTGLIKANFPTRIAFAVTSQTDSRVILDANGADKLLGQGDMLLMRPDAAKLQRIQGCYVSDPEIDGVVNFWKEWDLRENTEGPSIRVAPWIGLLDRMEDEESLLQDAIDLVRDMETCSTSLIQRKLRIGYPRAARLMEEMEDKGIVGPDLGGGQGREVLFKDEESEPDETLDEEPWE